MALFLAAAILFVVYRRQRRQLLDVAIIASALIVAWAALRAPIYLRGIAAQLYLAEARGLAAGPGD